MSVLRRKTTALAKLAPRAARVALVAVVILGVFALSGCRETDALKEIIYDQQSQNIDYDNPNKYYISNSESDKESNEVSSMEVSEEDPVTDRVQNLVVFSSEPNTSGFIAKMSKFSTVPDFLGIEASESVFFYRSDRVDAVDHAVTAEAVQTEEQAEDEDEPTETQQGNNEDDSDTRSDAAGTADPNGTTPGSTQEDDTGGGAKGDVEVIGDYDPKNGFSPNEQSGSLNTPSLAFDAFDPNSSPADNPISSFAAFGSYASMVQMLGGTGALVATDYETLVGFYNAGITGSGNIANGIQGDIKMGWRDDGSAAYMDVDAIIAAFQEKDPEGLAAGTCAIIAEYSAESYFGSYGAALDKLEAAGIRWVNLRPMDNTFDIKRNVLDVGDMLYQSGVAQYGAAAGVGSNSIARADKYVTLHDTAVSNANGGLALSANSGEDKVLQSGNDYIGSGGNTVYTLLIDGWDAQAVFSGHPFDYGVAFSSLGYTGTPVSYYIQAGGAINNAAVVASGSSTGELAVTQFSLSTLTPLSSTLTTQNIKNLFTGSIERSLLDSGRNTNAVAVGAGLGTAYMPKIIVTSSEIKQAMLLSSASSTSLYHPYTWVSSALQSAAGADMGRSVAYWSAIGANDGQMSADNPANPLGTALSDDLIVVNPNGIFCDWTEGTVESFLESTWVSAVFGNGYSYSQWESDVVDFYSWAYNVNIDIDIIVNQ